MSGADKGDGRFSSFSKIIKKMSRFARDFVWLELEYSR